MRSLAKYCSVLAVFACLLVASVPASADVEVTEASWQLNNGTVEFHVRFHNPDPNTSGAVSGEAWSQEFGAFLPNIAQLHTFDVPPLPPDAFFDVFFEVEIADLPPSAEIISPDANGGSLRIGDVTAQLACTNTQWAGNVDVFWQGPGGSGQVQPHMGLIPVCAGAGNSYIHILMDCQDPAGVTWSFTPLCAGWTASLVVDAGGVPGGAAPNPIPQGFFDGWICVSAAANTPIGTQCHFDLNVSCGTAPATVNLWAEVCSWLPVGTEESTWGTLKHQYSDKNDETETE